MSARHLSDLQAALSGLKWEVEHKRGGDGLTISGRWTLSCHRHPHREFEIAFDGMDDLAALPIEKSYACHLAGQPDIALYFFNSPEKWKKELALFIEMLEGFAVRSGGLFKLKP